MSSISICNPNKRKERISLIQDENEVENRVTCTDLVPYKKHKSICVTPTHLSTPTNEISDELEIAVTFQNPINGINYTLSEAFTVYAQEFSSLSVLIFLNWQLMNVHP